jgi:hypothetical protein
VRRAISLRRGNREYPLKIILSRCQTKGNFAQTVWDKRCDNPLKRGDDGIKPQGATVRLSPCVPQASVKVGETKDRQDFLWFLSQIV